MIEAEMFERKTFQVRAIRVTRENIAQLAESCGWRYVTGSNLRPHLVIPRNEERDSRAYLGNWITYKPEDGNGHFHVYSHHVFKHAFREILDEHEKREKIMNQVHLALHDLARGDKATRILAEQATDRIMEFI